MPNFSQTADFVSSKEADSIIKYSFILNGFLPSVISEKQMESGKEFLNQVLQGLLTEGPTLYLKTTIGQQMVSGQSSYSLPEWVSKAWQIQLLKTDRVFGGVAISSEGDASLAFDDNLETACTQVAMNGWIGFHFMEPPPIPVIKYVGIQSFVPATLTLIVEGSHDGVNWQSVYPLMQTTFYPENSMLWWVIPGAQPWAYLRVREVNNAVLNLAEVHFAVPNPSVQSLILGEPNSTTEYFTFPIAQPSSIPSAWTFYRTNPARVEFFPSPTTSLYDTFLLEVQGTPMNFDEYVRTMDFPARYLNYIQQRLAQWVAVAFNEKKVPLFKGLADEMLAKLVQEDVELVPLRIDYTNPYGRV